MSEVGKADISRGAVARYFWAQSRLAAVRKTDDLGPACSDVDGPLQPLADVSDAALQLLQTGHSRIAQHFRGANDGNAGRTFKLGSKMFATDPKRTFRSRRLLRQSRFT